MIRVRRPDLVEGRSEKDVLELRRDPDVAREITTRLVEQNAAMLRKRGLPVTPGTLCLAHFAGDPVSSGEYRRGVAHGESRYNGPPAVLGRELINVGG
jgi:hypothetical protein